MSAEAHPISAEQFSQAIEDLPIENIYSKANEIQNSIAHLQRSNTQLQEYSDSIKNDSSLDASIISEGDRDCLEAIRENEIVIKRQEDRIELLKKEVERRGGRWHGTSDASAPLTNGTASNVQNGAVSTPAPAQQPRLTDEELSRRLAAQLDDSDEGEEQGLHL